ncbi:hypothetical protein AOLI_G00314560 [Acnodon oligacanthus]
MDSGAANGKRKRKGNGMNVSPAGRHRKNIHKLVQLHGVRLHFHMRSVCNVPAVPQRGEPARSSCPWMKQPGKDFFSSLQLLAKIEAQTFSKGFKRFNLSHLQLRRFRLGGKAWPEHGDPEEIKSKVRQVELKVEELAGKIQYLVKVCWEAVFRIV